MDPKMEGVEKRLREQHDKIDVADTSEARHKSAVIDVPEDIDLNITPPRSLIRVLEGREGAKCGQAYGLVWETGQWQGFPVTGYCAEPLCINTGECTGTRFVPHVDQWTSDDPSFRQRRKMTPQEIVGSVRMFGNKAAQQTGRHEERTDKEILAHVRMVWTKTIQHLRDKGGDWRR